MPDPAHPGEKIPIASDHGGLELKEQIKRQLTDQGLEPLDLGCHPGEGSVDYPDQASLLCRSLIDGSHQRGILICGTGIGMSIAANRVPGIRAALCHDGYTARMCRLHNDANVLVLGGRSLGSGVAEELVDIFLGTAYEGGRHSRRLEKIETLAGLSPEPRRPDPS